MNCGFCGEENSDGARFCKKCGRRIDGKKACPKCGVLTDENSVYCENCGARLDGKKVCKKCGTAFDGNFCPSCGAGATAPKRSAGARQKAAPAPGGNESALSRILGWVSGGLAMAAVLFALIFVFLIGVGVSAGKGLNELLEELGMDRLGIKHTFAYFSQSFAWTKEVNDVFGETELSSGLVYGPNVVLSILQIIAAAATLITVIAFSVVAIVRFVKKAMGAKGKDCFPAALGAVISLAVGACVLFALSYVKITIVSRSLSLNIAIKLNGATIAGIVLSASFIGAAAILRLVIRGKQILYLKNILKACFGLLTAIAAIITMVLVPKMALKLNDDYMFGEGMTVYSGAACMLRYIADILLFEGMNYESFGTSYGEAYEKGYVAAKSDLVGSAIAGALSLIMLFIALVMIGYTLYRAVKCFMGEKAGVSTIVVSVAGFVAALVAMILLIVSGNLAATGVADFLSGGEYSSAANSLLTGIEYTGIQPMETAIGGTAIAAVILAFITAGLAVASFIVSRRDDEDDLAETSAQAEI